MLLFDALTQRQLAIFLVLGGANNGKGKGKEKGTRASTQKQPKKRAKRNDDDDDHLEDISKGVSGVDCRPNPVRAEPISVRLTMLGSQSQL